MSDFSETINEELRKINDNEKNDDDEDSVNVMSKVSSLTNYYLYVVVNQILFIVYKNLFLEFKRRYM